MICPNCKAQLPEDSVFCENCGRKLSPAGPGPQPVPQPVKKKSALPVILLIIVLVIIAGIVAGGFLAMKIIKAGKEKISAEIETYLTEDEEEQGDEEEPPEEEEDEEEDEDREEADEDADADADADREEEAFDEKEDGRDALSPKEEQGDWFEKAGLTLSDPEKLSFETTYRTIDENKSLGAYTAKGEGTTFIKTSDKAGFKEVVLYIDLDIGDLNGRNDEVPDVWITAFDRPTGICFEAGDNFPGKDGEGFTEIRDGIRVAERMEHSFDGDHLLVRYTATVPEDYDDTVFQLGYYDDRLSKEVRELSDSRLYRMDEMPTFDTNGHEYLYFEKHLSQEESW